MVREFSAGGVVIRQMRGRWWLAAIEPAGRSASGKKTVWALPKGLVDGGESPEQTALREVREETGVEAELIGKLADIKYIYTRSWGDRERVFKVVSFFLLRYASGKLGEIAPEMRIEVRRAKWIPLEDASQQLAYKGEREMAAKALAYIASNPEVTPQRR